MIGLCEFCAYKQSDCKGNKDLEKLKCDYYKKPIVMNVKQMAERIAELEAEVERLRNVQNMHNSDIISRAAAIKTVCKAVCEDDVSIFPECDQIKHCNEIQALLALPSAEAEWIPCSERLPSNDGCVLVTIDDGIEFGKYEDGTWSIWVCEHWDEWDAKGTIAWMPLPKPYREDGE